jgi:hypothetical protein
MAELGFAILGNKGRALIVKAKIPVKYHYHLFRDVFSTAICGGRNYGLKSYNI